MLENLTDCARRAMAAANDLAIKSGHTEVTPEHLLIGIIRNQRNGEQPGRIGLMLLCGEQNTNLIEEEMLLALSPAKEKEMPWSQFAKNAIQTAILTAGEKNPVRLGHLIIGILMQVCPAAATLNKHGIHHKNVMEQMQKYIQA